MSKHRGATNKQSTAWLSKDGRTAYVTLRMGRREYEFARSLAELHSASDPGGTVETYLEKHIRASLERCMSAAYQIIVLEEEFYGERTSSIRLAGDLDDDVQF